MADVAKFVEKTISLLNIERKAEVDEARSIQDNSNLKELERKGVCLLKLHVRSRCTGLYGRTLLTFESAKKTSGNEETRTLPAHRITPGDIVGVSAYGTSGLSSEICSGIVTRVTQATIIVAFDDASNSQDIESDGQYRLNRLANDVTYKRTKSAMMDLTKYSDGPASHLINVLFGHADIGPQLQSTFLDKYNDSTSSVFFNAFLNESQRNAVKFALSQREIAVIHGPPGTGKTTTVVEIILQAVKNLGLKVLACAPSNIAVDNMVEKLAKGKAKVVRLGHPARLLSSIQRYSLDAILTSSDSTSIIQDVRKDIDAALSKTRKSREPGEKRHLRQEIKTLRKELREREQKAMKEVLSGAEVVLATNTSAGNDGPLGCLPMDHFDLVVVDEAAQALEASCWIPLLRAKRCILSGDHLQLPPTIVSPEAAKKGLEITLMERVVKQYDQQVVRMLTTQYRMHESIMKWSSNELYNGRLEAHNSVRHHLLKDLHNVQETDETTIPLLLIDTTGCDVMELEADDEVSKGNDGEADIVAAHVNTLVNAGLDPQDIAVISPYNLQVELLRKRLTPTHPSLEIKSVDGFQGREKEAVVISLVRSNKQGIVGFLAEDRRINVAITRARRHLAIVCDSETVGHHSFLKSLITYMEENGEVRSAMEYLHGNTSCDVSCITQLTSAGSSDSRQDSSASSKINKEFKTHKKRNEKQISDVKLTEAKTINKQTFAGCNDLNVEPSSTNAVLPTDILNITGSSNETNSTGSDDLNAREPLTKEQLGTAIQVFLLGDEVEHVFGVELTAQERFYVHSIAEEVNLEHESKGENQQRHIVVRKKKPVKDPEKENDDFLSTCKICKKSLPTCNMELHLLRCEQLYACAPIVKPLENKSAGSSDKRGKSKKKKPEKSTKSTAKAETEEDFDAMLAEFTRKDTRCAYDSCKQCITMLGQKCRCCDNVFCLSHHIPEVHGCGNQAKILARKGLGKTEPRRQKKSDLTRKAQLHKKLENRLDEMSGKRKHKKKE